MKDPEHLAFLRSLPCAVYAHPKEAGIGDYAWHTEHRCSPNVEAHHRTGAGLALKASDGEAFPLCRKHHREFHDANGLFKGWTRAQRKEWQENMVKLYQPIDEVF